MATPPDRYAGHPVDLGKRRYGEPDGVGYALAAGFSGGYVDFLAAGNLCGMAGAKTLRPTQTTGGREERNCRTRERVALALKMPGDVRILSFYDRAFSFPEQSRNVNL